MRFQSIYRRHINALTIAIFILSLSAAQFTLAQDLVLEEVVVTAQKRAESLQDVPLTVTALSADAIQNAGIDSLDEIKTLIPSLNIYSVAGPATSSISVRGAGTGVTDPTLEPSVGVFVDGVFMPRSVFGLSDLVDVDRIEVLMGPQGTLYGKNTNAGVVAVHTKGFTEEFEGMAEVTAGENSLRSIKLSLGGAVSDTLGFRFAVVKRDRDGLLENEINGRNELDELDNIALRGQLFWNPTDRLSIRAIGYHSKREGSMGEGERVFSPNSALVTGPFAAIPAGGSLVGDDRKVFANQPAGGTFDVSGGSLQLDYEFANGIALTSISAVQKWDQSGVTADADGTPAEFLTLIDNMDEKSYSQEVRLTSPGGDTIDWLVGGFWFKSDLQRGSSDPSNPYAVYGVSPLNYLPDFVTGLAPALVMPGDFATWENQYETESFALFGQATWNISDTTRLTAGIRYSDEEKDFLMAVAGYDAAGTLFTIPNILTGSYTGGIFVPLTSGTLVEGGPILRESSRQGDDITGMLSLNHTIGDTMLYATVATGSKSGGFNGSFGTLSAEDREFDREKTTSYEVGAKMGGLLDGRARVNLAAFYTEYDDFQAATFDAATAVFKVDNAGKQLTKGLSLEAMLAATENLTLSTNLQYLDAKYKDYENASCSRLLSPTGICDFTGERMEFAPKWAGMVAADYFLPLNNGDEFYANLSFSFKTNHLTDPLRTEHSITSYELWDARMGWRKGDWDLSIWAKNLTDEIYTHFVVAGVINSVYAGVLDAGESFHNYNLWINKPRTIGVTVRYSF